MLKKKDVTVVIPVAKMSGKLQPLQETVKQLLTNQISVVIIHDHHDEATSRELKEIEVLMRKLGGIDLIENKYGGPGPARNAGIKMSSGDYIAFWDSDDLPNVKNFFEFAQDSIAKDSDIGIAEFVVNNGKKRREVRLPGFGFREDYREIALNPGIWRFIFKKSLITELLFPAHRLGEDQVFIAKALVKASRITTFKKHVYEYLLFHDGALTKDPKNLPDIVKSLEKLSDIYRTASNKVVSKFIGVMFWKMYLTLVTRPNSKNTVLGNLTIIKNLARNNPKLLFLVSSQFLIARNYKPLL
jgi:glycosyltransferase involved in cell wall biosynthesis